MFRVSGSRLRVQKTISYWIIVDMWIMVEVLTSQIIVESYKGLTEGLTSRLRHYTAPAAISMRNIVWQLENNL